MKTVILLRHAKSDWTDAVTRDFDRPLNARGRRAAAVMGAWAKNTGLAFDLVLASPAVRATETLALFLEAFGAPVETHWERRIYLASSATLLDVVRELPDNVGRVLMVGHNPGLEDFVLDLVPAPGGSALREQVEAKYPTASIAQIDFDCAVWRSAAKPAQLAGFIRPRDLDPSLGPDSL